MKKIKKLFIYIFAFFLFFFMLNFNTLATTGKIISVDNVETEEITKDLLFEHNKMNSYYNQNSPIENEVYTYTLKNNSKNLKLATWTYSSQNGYQNKTLMEIAKDYEAKHPGYIVLGGINTEGYVNSLDNNSVYELTNAFVQDGDVIRKDISAEETKEMIALNYNGGHVIKRVPLTSDNPYLYLYDELGNVSSHLEIKNINTLPNNNEISILTPKLNELLDLRGYDVIKCYYDLYRVTSNFPGGCISGNNYGIFFKGNILEKVSIDSISSVSLSCFYLVSKNIDFNGIYKNQKIKVQYDYLDEFGQVESAVGYWFKYLENNIVCDDDYKVFLKEENRYSQPYGSHDYYKSIYKERAGIGFKENGDVVILASNNTSRGPTQYEVGMYFKSIGCVDAYQFDGGGSVTFIKRDEMGNFNMLNYPADGAPRTILSGLFIVMKVEEISIDVRNVSSTISKINIKCENKEVLNNLNLEIKDNNGLIRLLPIDNESIDVDFLERNKEYTYHFYNDNIDTFVSGTFIIPYLDIELINISVLKIENGYKYHINYNDIDDTLIKMYLKVDKYNYKSINDDEIIINDLNIDPFDVSLRITSSNGIKSFDTLYDKDIVIDSNCVNYLDSIINHFNNLIDNIF